MVAKTLSLNTDLGAVDDLALDAARAIVDRQCSNPVRVSDGQYVRCGSRFRRRCPGCARLASDDWLAIIRSGIFDAPPTVRFLMVTLTAPSFGATHRVVKAGRPNRRCACGAQHDPVFDADLRGTPLDLDDYDYAGAVAWNHGSPELIHNLIRTLRGRYDSLAYVVVREWQERGLLHFHMLLRIDVAEMPSALDIEKAVGAVTAKTVNGRVIRFGGQVRAEFARADGDFSKTVWYLTKSVQYLVKEVELSFGALGRYARAHQRRLNDASRHLLRCRRCPEDAPCHSRCHKQWGARSRVVTQSRGRRSWSLIGLTRQKQREQRAEWAAAVGRDGGGQHTTRRFGRAMQARVLLRQHRIGLGRAPDRYLATHAPGTDLQCLLDEVLPRDEPGR